MGDVMAIVSRKVFEKQAGAIDVGDLWATRQYVSKNRGLEVLKDGGSLFLVTVRPDSVLWLVAVLEAPQFAEDRWEAQPNRQDIRDITECIDGITFYNGKTLTRGPKLGMSLQTPRAISPETSALLRTKQKLVPKEATWNDVTDNWEHGKRDDQGQREGQWQFWREDGKLACECPYTNNEPHGVNVRYHPDGSLASEGQWRNGTLYDSVHYRPKHIANTDEEWVSDAPDVIVCIHYLSKDGRTIYNTQYFDDKGVEHDRTGKKKPRFPKGVPKTARYYSDEDYMLVGGSVGGWVDGRLERGCEHKVGLWRWWSNKGKLLRTERHSAHGVAQPIEQRIDTFLESEYEHSAQYGLARVWNQDVHALMKKRLGNYPSSRTIGYLALLLEGDKEYRRIVESTVYYPEFVVEVVEGWVVRSGKETGMEAWFVYAAGVRAALSLRDNLRVQRWWKKVQSMEPKKKDGLEVFNRMAYRLAEVLVEIENVLDGTAESQVQGVKDLVKKGRAAELSNEQLSLLAAAEVGFPASVELRDMKTGEAWLLNSIKDEGTYYFNGKKFAPSDIEINIRSKNDVEFVMATDCCDERVVLWSGKHTWNVMQRYGRRVFWQASQYYSSRFQAEVTNICWFTAPNVNGAKRIIDLIRASLPKSARRIDPFMDKKLGVIVRTYKTPGLRTLGVYDNMWITGCDHPSVVDRFKDHRAAVAAFERMELEHMRNGAVITRFSAIGKPELD